MPAVSYNQELQRITICRLINTSQTQLDHAIITTGHCDTQYF